ncbi:MAG: glycosyltransferase [Dongiaceae bacterium]
MRIVAISNLYPPNVIGGYELFAERVARGLRRRGHAVTTLTTAGPLPGAEDDAVERCLWLADVYRPSPWPGGQPALDHAARVSCYANIDRVAAALRRLRPELVLLHNPLGLGVLGLIDLLDEIGVGWLWLLGDKIPAQALADLPPDVAALFRCAHRRSFAGGSFVSVSSTLLHEIRTAGIELGPNVEVVPCWCEPVPPGPRPPHRGPLRCVATGQIGREKGIHLIVAAAAALARRPGPPVTIDVQGAGELAHYATLARAEGADEIIRFHGFRPHGELVELYRRSDVFLFPSRTREPFGLAHQEAAAEGCAVVMTRGGSSERFVDGVHCLKIDRTVPALLEAIERLARDRDLAAALGRRAAALVRGGLAEARLLPRLEAPLAAAVRPLDWDRVDWARILRLALYKDRLAQERAAAA